MELWYTEEWTDNVRFSIKVDKHLFSDQSDFQRVDVFESKEFGKFLTLDGLMMVSYKDEFIYHDMIVHVPMATNMNIKNVLVIGGGDGGTVRELTRYPQIEKIDMVEIDKMVVDVSREYIDICASGHWLFGFASKKYDPIKDQNKEAWESLNLKTKYYNSNIHTGAFMLPQYVVDMLNEK